MGVGAAGPLVVTYPLSERSRAIDQHRSKSGAVQHTSQ
jgi:hypothetical protein